MSVDEILESVGRLPSPPHAIAKIIRTLDDGDATAEMLAKQIETDTGLIASILRLVNSSHYAISGGVPTIRQAIVLLGFDTIRNLVCVKGISEYFQKECDAVFNYKGFVRHCIGVGCVARVLAKPVFINQDSAFIAAMLLDIGQFGLAISAPNEYESVMDYKKEHNCNVIEAENAVMGIDHCKIGAHLAKLWNLPVEFCNAIEYHHNPDASSIHSPLADLIHVAEVLANSMELGASDLVTPLSDNAMIRLKLSLQQVATSLGKIDEEFTDYSQMMLGDVATI